MKNKKEEHFYANEGYKIICERTYGRAVCATSGALPDPRSLAS
jgi:hypothetical protein